MGDIKKVLITGISGQDGSYLADLLLEKDYEVHGVVRYIAKSPIETRMQRIQHIADKIHVYTGDIENLGSIWNIVNKIKPDECYHLAAVSFVGTSFEDEFTTMQTNLVGTHNILFALKSIVPQCKFYFAGSSEQFGNTNEDSMDENTPFYPRSSYGIAKVAGYNLTRFYREAHNMHASSGILFNHESPRRGEDFVTQKVTKAAAQIAKGKQNDLILGNIDAQRDWGHAKDYVQAMWMMLQENTPSDFVIATGVTHSVRDLCRAAFSYFNLDYEKYIKIDDKFKRPTDIEYLRGNYCRAQYLLDWEPSYSFTDLINEMAQYWETRI